MRNLWWSFALSCQQTLECLLKKIHWETLLLGTVRKLRCQKKQKKPLWRRCTISNGSHFFPPGISTIGAITVRIAITACERYNSTNNSAIPPSVQAVHPTVFQPSLLFDNGHKQHHHSRRSLPPPKKRVPAWFSPHLNNGGGDGPVEFIVSKSKEDIYLYIYLLVFYFF